MKLKRGTAHILDGKTPVWVELDAGGDCVFVCTSKERHLQDTFIWVVRKSITPAKKVAHKSANAFKSKTVERLNNKSDLDKWYESQDVPERCENCNQKLNAFNKWAKRCVTAHIVPKSLFPEVATHPANRAFMGVALFGDCSCHNTFDHLDADTRKQMPIYPKIVERVKEFIHLIPENKLPKLEKYLGLND
jgi:hypothetical protein